MKKIITIIAIIVVLVIAGIAVGVHTVIDKGRPDNKGTPTEVATTADAEATTEVDDTTVTTETEVDETATTEVTTEAKTKDKTEATTEVASNTKQDAPVSNTAPKPKPTPEPTTEAQKPTPAPATHATETPATTTTEAPTPEPTTTHQHSWITMTDKEAWDEPIYEEEEVWEIHHFWPDGTMCDELADPPAKTQWCINHCVSCFPNCPEPDPAGRCAFTIYWTSVYMGTKQVQVGTTHHDAVTHQECSTCGARQ